MKLLSESLIKTIAGEKVFARGREVYEAGQCGELNIDRAMISVSVDGSETYQVTLQHTNKLFEGSCSCPASDHFDFCKHCVAAALKYYYQTQGNQELADTLPENRLQAYLATLTKPELEQALAQLIRSNPDQLKLWQLRAELANGQLDAKALRKHITAAIPYKSSGLWRYQEVSAYFNAALDKLSAIEPALHRLPVPDALKLLVYAYERLEKTVETVDDSGGYRFALMEFLDTSFKRFFSQDGHPEKQRVDLIVKLLNHPKYSYEFILHPDGPSSLLTPEEHKLLLAQLKTIWDKLPAPAPSDRLKYTALDRIQSVLVSDAKAKKNSELEIELLGKTAIDVRSCVDLARRCIELDALSEANKWLSYASQIEQLGVHDVRLIEHTQIALWLAEGNLQKALDAQWLWFEEEETLEALQEVLTTAERLKLRKSHLSRGIEHLKTTLLESGDTSRGLDRAETLIGIYLHEQMIDDAIKLATQSKLRAGSLMAVVNHADTLSIPVRAIAERAIGFLCDFGSNETYERAVNFMAKIEQRFDDEALFADLVQRVYQRPNNKSKRNFIHLLKSNFPRFFEVNTEN